MPISLQTILKPGDHSNCCITNVTVDYALSTKTHTCQHTLPHIMRTYAADGDVIESSVTSRQRQLVVLWHVETASTLAETCRHQLTGGEEGLCLFVGRAEAGVDFHQVDTTQLSCRST